MIIDSFNSLYTNYYQKAFLFTKSYLHDDLISEDIVSESLISLWNMLRTQKVEHLPALLFTILRNKSLDHLRNQAVKQRAIDNLTYIEQRDLEIRISTLQACEPSTIFLSEVEKIIEETLEILPEQTALIFKLSRFENKTNKEIAEDLNITVKGVEYHITKTLKLMRISLKDYLTAFVLFYIF